MLGIAADADGNAYLTGTARRIDFPTTPASYQPSRPNGSDAAYVAKLDPTGSRLVYSTFLQPINDTFLSFGFNIVLDSARNAFVIGQTGDPKFPVVHPVQSTPNGSYAMFISTVSATGSDLLFSTFLGGSLGQALETGPTITDRAGLALDKNGAIYVASNTNSTDFPVTTGAFQAQLHNSVDGFVAKISPVTATGAGAEGGADGNGPDGSGTAGDAGAPGEGGRSAVGGATQGNAGAANGKGTGAANGNGLAGAAGANDANDAGSGGTDDGSGHAVSRRASSSGCGSCGVATNRTFADPLLLLSLAFLGLARRRRST